MSFRFQQHISLFPGVRLNLSGSGVSVSLGVSGATLNFGGRAGSSVTVGIPGTGVSYRHSFSAGQSAHTHSAPPSLNSEFPPAPLHLNESQNGAIRSESVSTLTTPDLEGLKKLLNETLLQRRTFEKNVRNALTARSKAWRSLERKKKLPLSILFRGITTKYNEIFEQCQNILESEVEKLNGCYVNIDFNFDKNTLIAYDMLQIHHEKLRLCQKIWDVTSSIFVDRVRTRSAASHAVTRKLVSLSFSQSSLVASKWRGLRFENANGGDLEFFPAFCLIRERNGTDYALIDIRNIDVRFNSERFIENEQVPNDAQVVGQAWEKSNKDGSPDRRFGNNRQFPVLGYGVVEL